MESGNYPDNVTISQRSPFDPATGRILPYVTGPSKNSITDGEPPPYSIDAGECETESNDLFPRRFNHKVSQPSNGEGHGSETSSKKIIKNIDDDGTQQNDNDKSTIDDDGSKGKKYNCRSTPERKNENEEPEEISGENIRRDAKDNRPGKRYLVSIIKDYIKELYFPITLYVFPILIIGSLFKTRSIMGMWLCLIIGKLAYPFRMELWRWFTMFLIFLRSYIFLRL